MPASRQRTDLEALRRRRRTAQIRERIALRGLTLQMISERTLLAEGTINNAILGTNTSGSVRQRITDYVGETLWPGIAPRVTSADAQRVQEFTKQCEAIGRRIKEAPSEGERIAALTDLGALLKSPLADAFKRLSSCIKAISSDPEFVAELRSLPTEHPFRTGFQNLVGELPSASANT